MRGRKREEKRNGSKEKEAERKRGDRKKGKGSDEQIREIG